MTGYLFKLEEASSVRGIAQFIKFLTCKHEDSFIPQNSFAKYRTLWHELVILLLGMSRTDGSLVSDDQSP